MLNKTRTISGSASLSSMLPRQNAGVLIVAHRGAWTIEPENSLSAITTARELGADIVEIDAQATADGVLVLMHDETLERTTDRSGALVDLPFAAIRQTRLRSGAGGPIAEISDERLPTLAEALEVARGMVALNIDTKFEHDLEQVAALVLDMGMDDQVLLKSYIDLDADPCSVMKTAFFGKIPYMPIMPARRGHFAEDLKRIMPLGVQMVEVDFDALDELASASNELERQNLRLWVNTIDVSHSLDFNDTRALQNPDAIWGALIDAGVGVIQTDVISELANYLSTPGR